MLIDVLCFVLFVLVVFPSADAIELFCICRTPYDNDRFYLGCESCENWFHGKCVHITEEQVRKLFNRLIMLFLWSFSTFVTTRSFPFDCFHHLSVCLIRQRQAALIEDYICEACEKKTGRITTFVDNVSRRGQLQRHVEISAELPVWAGRADNVVFVLLFFLLSASFVVCF